VCINAHVQEQDGACLNSRDIIAKHKNDGWVLPRVSGSHHQFKHTTTPDLVTVPHPRRDIQIGTLRSIYKQAGWPWPPDKS
jgi:predicted RNA binding protein YcfA (HicA-like mRNA interferase family)